MIGAAAGKLVFGVWGVGRGRPPRGQGGNPEAWRMSRCWYVKARGAFYAKGTVCFNSDLAEAGEGNGERRPAGTAAVVKCVLEVLPVAAAWRMGWAWKLGVQVRRLLQ